MNWLRATIRAIGLLVSFVFLVNCSHLYFHPAQSKPPLTGPVSADHLNGFEYWTGIVFNGERVGFTHLKVATVDAVAGRYRIDSEAFLRFRFLMFDKRIALTRTDIVASDLRLVRFDHRYDIDGSVMFVSGHRQQALLVVSVATGHQSETRKLPLEGEVYPASAILLYPFTHGLEIGRRYQFKVFDGETQTLSTVMQHVTSFEESDLFSDAAFRVETHMRGHQVTTWLNQDGRPVLELSLGGVIIAAIESRREARNYVVADSFNKKDVFIDFSLIKPRMRLDTPRSVHTLDVRITGIGARRMPPNDARQRCNPENQSIYCRISADSTLGTYPHPPPSQMNPYLAPTFAVPVRNPTIRDLAAEINQDVTRKPNIIENILSWIEGHIEQVPVDSFTALDVLQSKQAECQGHAYLFAALSRASGIPTRIVNGLVYSDVHDGFLYHTWVECAMKQGWKAVDPTLNQFPADATHIKLIEGESLADLMPLADVIGSIGIEILSYQ